MVKINYKKGKEIKAQVGDLIKFEDEVIALVLNYNEIVLINYTGGDSWFKLSKDGYKDDFNNGDYKVIAKAGEWEINIK